MAQFTTPEGGVQTFEPHETSNTPPSEPDPAPQAIGPLPDYGTMVPDQGGSLTDKAVAALTFLESLPEDVIAEVQRLRSAKPEVQETTDAGTAPETADTADGVAGDPARDGAPDSTLGQSAEATPAPEAAPEGEPAAVVPEGPAEPASTEEPTSNPDAEVPTGLTGGFSEVQGLSTSSTLDIQPTSSSGLEFQVSGDQNPS